MSIIFRGFLGTCTKYTIIWFLTASLGGCMPPEITKAVTFISSQFRDPKTVEFQNLKSSNAVVCGEVSFSDRTNSYRAFKRFVVKKIPSGWSGTVEDFGAIGAFEGFKLDELILKEAATKYIIHLSQDFSDRQQKIKRNYPSFVPDEHLQKVFFRYRKIFDFYRTHELGWGVQAKLAGDKLGRSIAFEEAYNDSCSFNSVRRSLFVRRQ